MNNPHVQRGGGYKSFSMGGEFFHPHPPLHLKHPSNTQSFPTNRPRNSQSITIPYPMDRYHNDEVDAFNDAVDSRMKCHIDALFLPQDSVSCMICCPLAY